MHLSSTTMVLMGVVAFLFALFSLYFGIAFIDRCNGRVETRKGKTRRWLFAAGVGLLIGANFFWQLTIQFS